MDTLFEDTEIRERVEAIEEAFLKIAFSPDIHRRFPTIYSAAESYLSKKHLRNDESEIAFLDLYCEIHRAGSSYSKAERQRLDDKQGYFNHPGGLSPVIKARHHIQTDSTSADLGAGNGLQGLLFQYLYPHRQTYQIELSSTLIEIGKQFQKALEIDDSQISWVNDDILNIDLDDIDFLYLYRPSKPIENGKALYENLEAKLNNRNRGLTIFSIADCLKDYLNTDYSVFYNDGHLTCFYLDR